MPTSVKDKMSLLKIASIETLYFDRIYALQGISLDVKENDIFAVLGPNGAGKTTLLKTIAGLLKDQPKKGIIEFCGKKISGLSPEKIASMGIVYVPEDRGLFRELTVKENLDLGCWGRRDKDVKDDIDFIYDLFPILKERGEQQAETLSGGEQQMLAMGRALMSKPSLVMMDEPSTGLAPLIVRDIFQVIVRLRAEGNTVLLVEQNAKAALAIADRGYVLETGKVIIQGPAEDLLANKDVQRAYLGREKLEE